MRLLALLALFFFFTFLQACNVFAQEVATISVSKSPYGIAVNSNTQRLYVATTDFTFSNSVSVIDTFTNLVLSEIAIPPPSKRITVNTSTNTVFAHAVFPTGNGVTIIDGLTNNFENTFFFNGVSSSNFNSVIHSNVHIKDILGGISVNTATNMIYGANYNFSSIFTFNGLDPLRSLVLIKQSPSFGLSGFMSYWTDVNPTTNKIYFVHSMIIDVFDGSTNNVIGTIRPTANKLSGIGVNSVTNKIYVGKSLGDSHFVSVIDGSNDSILTDIEVSAPVIYLAVNPSINKIYALLNDEVGPKLVYIDGSANNILASFSIGSSGDLVDSVAVDPNTEKVYVSFPGLKLVKVFDGSLTDPDPIDSESSNGSSINLSQDFTGIWKASDSKTIKLNVCVKDGKINGLINQKGALKNGVITSVIPISENEVDIDAQDELNRSIHLKLKLLGQRQLLIIFDDNQSIKARKVNSFRACLIQDVSGQGDNVSTDNEEINGSGGLTQPITPSSSVESGSTNTSHGNSNNSEHSMISEEGDNNRDNQSNTNPSTVDAIPIQHPSIPETPTSNPNAVEQPTNISVTINSPGAASNNNPHVTTVPVDPIPHEPTTVNETSVNISITPIITPVPGVSVSSPTATGITVNPTEQPPTSTIPVTTPPPITTTQSNTPKPNHGVGNSNGNGNSKH